MEYIQVLSRQLVLFLQGIGFGFVMGGVYDFFKIIRVCLRAHWVTVACDLIYSGFVTLSAFCFILAYADGEIRGYVILAEVLGWLVWFLSFSTITAEIASGIRGAFLFIMRPLCSMKGKIGKMSDKTKELLKKERKKSANN